MSDGLCDRRYSEMSQREIDILMNDRWALLCVFTVSVALIGSDLLLLLLFVFSCDFLSDRSEWSRLTGLLLWVKGEERLKDLRLFQRRTERPLLLSSIFDIYNLLKAACVVLNESMLILECKNTSNEAQSGPLLLVALAQQLLSSRVGVWVTCVTAAFQQGFGPSDWPTPFLSFLFPETCWTKTHFLSQIHVSTKQKPFLADMDVYLYI